MNGNAEISILRVCLFLLSFLPVFALCILELLLLGAYTLRIALLLGGLTALSLCNVTLYS